MREKVIRELQDLRYLEWSKVRKTSGTAGSFLKSQEAREGRKLYYKLSCYDSVHGITGHESVNEIIADRLLSILGIPHLEYQLLHCIVKIDGKERETWLCASEDFKSPGDSKIALDELYDLEKLPEEGPMEFCVRRGWGAYVYEMLVVDYLILNRDRHGANIEILRNRRDGRTAPAPLFDHGLSLLYSCHTEAEAGGFDIMKDLPVQCFVGSRSARENLDLIPAEERPVLRPLQQRDRSALFRDLEDALPKVYQDKIWEMIWRRWQVYEDISHRG
ncbi:MAG: hypothetical protein IJ128_07410 [Firmicutes bacterium]|nr:hypothetical protein [Bacillota bacterium]